MEHSGIHQTLQGKRAARARCGFRRARHLHPPYQALRHGTDVHCVCSRPAVLITLDHLSASDLMNAANCAGVVATGSAPCLVRYSLVSGTCSMRAISCCNLLMIAGGVPVGAIIPLQPNMTSLG